MAATFRFIFRFRAGKPNIFIHNMIYHQKDNFAGFPMVYHVSLYLLCVRSYRQNSDVGVSGGQGKVAQVMIQITQERFGHDSIFLIAIQYSFKNTILQILKNSRRNSRWRPFIKMAASFSFSAILSRGISIFYGCYDIYLERQCCQLMDGAFH